MTETGGGGGGGGGGGAQRRGGGRTRITIREIAEMKRLGKPISTVTSYDYTLASLCDRAGVDILLVGDSAGMVMLGYGSTVPVTMDEMCVFTGAVSRAREGAAVVADMPFMSYQASEADAIRNAGRLIKAGADAVKLEGGGEAASRVRAIADSGIPVMGHIGLQPQTATLLRGYRGRGRTAAEAGRLIGDAKSLEGAGAFAIVLEMVAGEAAGLITREIGIPTIGIGSGPECDGQVLVLQDMLGMYDQIRPSFVKRYMNLAGEIVGAVSRYMDDVTARRFPADGNRFMMDAGEYERLLKERGAGGRRGGGGSDKGGRGAGGGQDDG